MGVKWPMLTLREANVTLIDCDHRTPPASNAGYPYVTIPQLRNGRIDLSDVRRITQEHFIDWTRKARPSANDVVLSRRCNPGETAFVSLNLEFALGQNLVLLRSDGTKIHPPFLRWLVRGPEWWEQVGKFLNVGAVFDSLKCADVPNFKLRIPPIAEQRAIAEILGSLDDKIELNRRMNETLEGIARAVFKSWFVDFDPVRAKMEGRQPMGLDAATAALFPNAFQDSPLGKIPRGWKAATLGEHVEATKGLSYKGAGLSDTGTPLHNLNSIYEGGGYKYEGIKYYTGEHKDRHLIIPGDVIVANTEQGHDCLLIAYAAIVPETFGEQGLFSHHLYRLRIRDGSPVTVEFLCQLLNSPHMHDVTSGYGNGTTVNMLPLDGVQKPEFLLPPGDVMKLFGRFAESIRKRCELFVAENGQLGAIRDALLPKLLSGELRVPGAAQLIEVAR